ncbi:MAG: hypothetical protein PVI59_05955 [Anaerolineae bacterium]
MKTVLWIGLGVAVVFGLVLVGLVGGWAIWGRHVWATQLPVQPGAYGDMGPGMRGWTGDPRTGYLVPREQECGWGGGPGMMGGGAAECPQFDQGSSSSWEALSIEEAYEAAEAYVDQLGYAGLTISEVMEFERNFYAIAVEADTGIGAMELLIEKSTGQVGPEMGPNMMWNTRYGMHARGGRMMGWCSGGRETNDVTAAEALEIAQRWLDANRPGVTVEHHADPFYGYYTIHTQEDGEIEGMLSVHGSTGQVWYHTWHGAFIQMIEGEASDH